MPQAGKMEEIADELKKYNIQITALQEVRWPQGGWIKKKNYTLDRWEGSQKHNSYLI